jgi:hypothetical protein
MDGVISIVVAAALGGTGGVALARWLGRGRPQVTLVSIRRASDTNSVIRVPGEVMEDAERFGWSTSLTEVTSYDRIRKASDTVDLVLRACPSAKRLAERLKSSIPNTVTNEAKREFIEKLFRSYELRESIAGGLRQKEFSFTLSVDSSGPLTSIFEQVDTTEDGKPLVLVQFPTFSVVFDYSSNIYPQGELDKIRPFILAAQFFDVPALEACLDYGINRLQRDIDIAGVLKPKLLPLLESKQWQLVGLCQVCV